MKKALVIAMLPLLAACAGQSRTVPLSPAPTVAGAMNAPEVLRAQRIEPVQRVASRPAQEQPVRWNTIIDYDHTIYNVDLVSYAFRNQDTARPTFATFKRSFGYGEFQPYFGVGMGWTSSKFASVDPGQYDGLALTGVVGGNLALTDFVGAYVQYDYAVASENQILLDEDTSHGIRLGVNIALN